jgi:hypothetical protein
MRDGAGPWGPTLDRRCRVCRCAGALSVIRPVAGASLLSMGELGAIRRYHYWSDRSIAEVASDNDIALNGRMRWALRFPNFPFIAQLELGSQESRDRSRAEVASKVETAIGQSAVEDFVTPPPVMFAKGVGHMEFARTTVRYATNDGAVMHTVAKSSVGRRVDVCLFGSMDNFGHYVRAASSPEGGWTSSAWYAIEELLASRGTVNTSQWDDDQSIAVEALQIALHQGETHHVRHHEGRPWTRGFTIGGADAVEWLAVIFKDVELDQARWDLDEHADRIVVGAPLWIRTPRPEPITLYHRNRATLAPPDLSGSTASER